MNNNNNNASISYYNFYAPNATSTASTFNWPQSKLLDIQNLTESQSNYRNQYDTAYDTLLARGNKQFNVRHFNSTHRKYKRPLNTTQVYKRQQQQQPNK